MCNTLIGFLTGDFKFDYLVKEVSAMFLYYEITILPFVINKYLGEDTHYCKILNIHTSVIL